MREEVYIVDIPMDAEVYCLDGKCGLTTSVIIDPKSELVTHVVVREQDSPHTERIVPFVLVGQCDRNCLKLQCTKDEVSAMDTFLEKELIRTELPYYTTDPYSRKSFVTAESGIITQEHERIPPGELAVHHGARVEASDGHVGKVDEFLVDTPSGNITHLVLQEGHLWGKKDVSVPVSKIDRIEEDTVYLKLSKKEIAKLPAIPIRKKA
jgi:sporulation protein YlmC with PRC-barrel domain